MVRPTVFVCHGSRCRHAKRYAELREHLDAVADIAEVGCQKICKGPVAGVAVHGSLEWFERVRTDKLQRQLVDLVAGTGRLRHALEKRRVAKRAGKLR